MRSVAVDSQTIQHGDSKSSDEVAVRPASYGAFAKLEPDIACQFSGVLEEFHDRGVSNERGPVYLSSYLDLRSIENRFQCGKRAQDPLAFSDDGVAHIDAGSRVGGDYIAQYAAAHDANIERRSYVVVAHRVYCEGLMRELGYRADSASRIVSGMSRTALDQQLEFASALSTGFHSSSRDRRFQSEERRVGKECRV